MATDTESLRLHVPQEAAIQAVKDAIARGRVKFIIREEREAYFKLKQRRQFIYAPVKLEVGFRRESPQTTLVIMDGTLGFFWAVGDRPVARLRDQMAKFADDVQHEAGKFVRQ
jgi:hypothetical protein